MPADAHATFRLATAADAEVLLRFMRAFYDASNYPFDLEAARKALMPLLEPISSAGRVWVIGAQGLDVGYVVLTLGHSLEYRGRDAFVDEIYVEPQWRGRGFGLAAMEVAIQACRELDVRALHLEVERDNDSALALYRRLGFRDHDRYLMTKPIAS